MSRAAKTRPSLNPFTPPSSTSSMDSEARDILEPSVTLEEGLRRSQLRGMKSVEQRFTEVHGLYKGLHGEALSQQGAISSVEESTLRTALLTGQTVEELEKAKTKKDRKLRFRLYCIGVFIVLLIVWLGLVLGLPKENDH
jgi:t-SNARE complex subunit (syntaxin)